MIKRIRILALILLSSPLMALAAAGGTSIGDGSDPIFQFLESTRYALRETLTLIRSGEISHDLICRGIKRLTPEQRMNCETFTVEVLEQLLELNRPTSPTAFVLRDEPLSVEGPDGLPMPVAARTQPGAMGPIEFHRASVEYLSPGQMLMLMAHEFGHKVVFRGHPLRDNQPVLGFARGRDLLDSFAQAISEAARVRSLIGRNFGMRDLFACQVSSAAGSFRVRVSTERKFLGDNYVRYTLTLGHYPSDPQIEVPELGGATLFLRFQVQEQYSCLESGPGRVTGIEVIRVFPATPGEEPKFEVISQQTLAGFNPICAGPERPMIIEASGLQFSCRFLASEGIAASERP